MRAQEADAFFSDFGELEQQHYLEAGGGVSYGARYGVRYGARSGGRYGASTSYMYSTRYSAQHVVLGHYALPLAFDELERRMEARDTDTTGQAGEHTDSPTPNSFDGTDSTAQDVLALLARELPKLVHQAKGQTLATSAPSEQSHKRRRQDHVLDVIPQLDGAPRLPEPDTLEPILSAYFAHIHP
ncbi:hypothetical protein EJ07DRAFT_172884 [Lizonia empirigonia]|nr:hypothetical protein EJ07DRAFT_172884 [Lizonia empirigonia]